MLREDAPIKEPRDARARASSVGRAEEPASSPAPFVRTTGTGPESAGGRVRRLVFGGAGGGSAVADLGLLLLRVFAGLSLAWAHGLGKLPPSTRFLAGVAEMGFPLPTLFGWAAGLSEFVGGMLLALGFLTRPAAFFIAVTMSVAALIRQAGDPFRERELALLFGCVAVMFLLTGAGRYSVDSRFWRRTGRGRRAR